MRASFCPGPETRLQCRKVNLAATTAIVLSRRFYIVKSIRRNDHVVCLVAVLLSFALLVATVPLTLSALEP